MTPITLPPVESTNSLLLVATLTPQREKPAPAPDSSSGYIIAVG